MNYVIVIPDGAADEPLEQLDGRTPIEYAHTPNLDTLAHRALIGRSCNVPDGFSPGSDVATLSLLGYDPAQVYTGRAPLEAISQGIPMRACDFAFRCNLVTLGDGTMKSFTADHISSDEARLLLATLDREIAPQWNEIVGKSGLTRYRGTVHFYPGVSYRNTLLFEPETAPEPDSRLFDGTVTSPPHDYTDKPFAQALPRGDGSALLLELMERAAKCLVSHPVNLARIAAGKMPATHAWLWGQGNKPNVAPFAQRHPRITSGKMITAVDLLRGIAMSIGWEIVPVPNITGYVDTDYAAKGRYAADNIADNRIVCVHVEATDESGHEGDYEKKVKALEDIDAKVLPPILEKLTGLRQWRLLVSPDHPTPCRLKTHSRGMVPWMIAGSDLAVESPDQTWNERTAEKSQLAFTRGWELMNFFLE